jgi:hypothetical protein
VFVDGLKTYRAPEYHEDLNLLHSAINSVKGWCITIVYEYENISEIKVVTLSKGTKAMIYE